MRSSHFGKDPIPCFRPVNQLDLRQELTVAHACSSLLLLLEFFVCLFLHCSTCSILWGLLFQFRLPISWARALWRILLRVDPRADFCGSWTHRKLFLFLLITTVASTERVVYFLCFFAQQSCIDSATTLTRKPSDAVIIVSNSNLARVFVRPLFNRPSNLDNSVRKVKVSSFFLFSFFFFSRSTGRFW